MDRFPTETEIFGAVLALEPEAPTVQQVADALGCPWEMRGTIRNRVYDLIARGLLIEDEGRPMRVAVNHLEPR
jgi:hypothetical protein